MEVKKLNEVCSLATGSCRGYVRVAERNTGALYSVPSTINGLRGNERKAMKAMIDSGAERYKVQYVQGVPGKGYSTRYYYTVYTGYTLF